MSRKNILALEAGHRRKAWSAAQDRFDMRAALRAVPPNLFAAIVSALEGGTPHALDMRATIDAEQDARYAAWLRTNQA